MSHFESLKCEKIGAQNVKIEFKFILNIFKPSAIFYKYSVLKKNSHFCLKRDKDEAVIQSLHSISLMAVNMFPGSIKPLSMLWLIFH